MNIWKHCLLSKRKFGGEAEDYLEVHRFMDSSKLFYYHAKHRVLLHNLYGIELCTMLYGDCLQNSDKKMIPIKEIAAEHCKEDLSNVVPTLADWLKDNEAEIAPFIHIPGLEDEDLRYFIMLPFLRSGLQSSLMITCSDFGVFLVEKFFGLDKAILWAKALNGQQPVKIYLEKYKFTQRWQYTPDKAEIAWLNNNP